VRMMAAKQHQNDDQDRQGGEIGKKSVIHQVRAFVQAVCYQCGARVPADGMLVGCDYPSTLQEKAGICSLNKCFALTLDPCRVANCLRSGRHITGDDGARSNDGVVPNRDPGKDDGAPSDPYVGSNPNRSSILEVAFSQSRIEGMIRTIDLYRRAICVRSPIVI
jgi:hypothetical protein